MFALLVCLALVPLLIAGDGTPHAFAQPSEDGPDTDTDTDTDGNTDGDADADGDTDAKDAPDTDVAPNLPGVEVVPDLSTPESCVRTYEEARSAIHRVEVGFQTDTDPSQVLAEMIPLLESDSAEARTREAQLNRTVWMQRYQAELAKRRVTLGAHRTRGETEALVLVRRFDRELEVDESGVYRIVERQTNVDVRVRRVGETWRIVAEQAPELPFPAESVEIDVTAPELPRARETRSWLAPVGATEREMWALIEDLHQRYLSLYAEYWRLTQPSREELAFQKAMPGYLLQWFAPATPEDREARTYNVLVREDRESAETYYGARLEHQALLERFAFRRTPVGEAWPWEGQLDEIRFSHEVLYEETFEPAETLEDDDATFLFRFNDYEDDHIGTEDATSSGYIASWVIGYREDGEPILSPGVWWPEDPRTQRRALGLTATRWTGLRLESGRYGTDIDMDYFHAPTEFTLEAWVYALDAEIGRPQVIAAKWGDWSANPERQISGYRLMIDTQGRPTLQLGNGAAVLEVTGPAMIEPRVWTHIAATFSAFREVRLYVNGAEVAGGTLSSSSVVEGRRDPDPADIDAATPFGRVLGSPARVTFGATGLPDPPPMAVKEDDDDADADERRAGPAQAYRQWVQVDGYYLDTDVEITDEGERVVTFTPMRLQATEIPERYRAAQMQSVRTDAGYRIASVRLPGLGE